MLGDRISALRKSKGLSQMELAKELSICASTIGMYEQGRREPGIEMLIKLAQIFQVSLDFLITGHEYPEWLCNL